MTNTEYGALQDFKRLAPSEMKVSGDTITVKTVLDFDGIDEVYAFSYIANHVGYVVRFEKEDVTISSDDANCDLDSMKIIAAFLGRIISKKTDSKGGTD